MAFFNYKGQYSVKLLAENRRKLFVFGDNFERRGMGGQAIIRSCPNAIGVATKAAPSDHPAAFFTTANFHSHIDAVMADLRALCIGVSQADIVVPFTSDDRISLGLGLARLDQTSPTTYAVISDYINALAVKAGGWRDF